VSILTSVFGKTTVSAICTVAIIGTACYGFIAGQLSGETFSMALGGAIFYLYKFQSGAAK
jgi:hypothetical protein